VHGELGGVTSPVHCTYVEETSGGVVGVAVLPHPVVERLQVLDGALAGDGAQRGQKQPDRADRRAREDVGVVLWRCSVVVRVAAQVDLGGPVSR
jgi:hypothetical protein